MTNSNVTPIESKQTSPGVKFIISCALSGFPITIEGEGRAGDLKTIIDRLLAIGAEPPAQVAASSSEPAKPAGVPTCPVHHSEMKSGRRGFYCPKKVGDGYCKEVA